MILNSPYISGSLTVTGNIIASGSITLSGSVASASYALSASNAATASSADNFLTRGTLTAQTLVVQTITSSVDFVTGSTRFGSIAANTHIFTGSMYVTGAFYVATGSVGIGTVSPSQLFEVVGGEIKAGRVDSSNEGGQISFGRSTDNATAWYIDAYGSTSSPILRFVDVTNAVVAMTITGSNVGIGTTSPNDLLEVRGGFIRLSATSGNGPQFNLYSNGQTSNHVTLAQGFALATDNIGYLINRANADFVFGTNNTERMRITSGGNVGIGVATANWDSTIRSIEIGNRGGFYAGFNSAAISVIYLGTNAYYNEGWKYANTSVYRPQILDCGDGNFHFQNASAGTAGNAITWNSLMRITSAGNVGIGTSSPVSNTGSTRTLQIGGSTIIQSVVNNQSIFGDNVYYDGGGWKYATTNNAAAIRIGAATSGEITFHLAASGTAGDAVTNWDGSDIKMRITTGGVLRFGVPFNNYQLDTSTPIAIASGGTIPFETFSGLIIINNMSNGVCAMWLCGAGATSLIGQGGGGATGTLSYSVGINGYVWTAPATANYGVFAVRTRANA